MSAELNLSTGAIVAGATRLWSERKLPLFARIRFQLGGALVAGLIIPLFVRWPTIVYDHRLLLGHPVLPSLTASFVAIVLGYCFVRQFSPFSGRLALGHVLPGLLVSFAVVSLVLFWFRIDYSRYVLVSSYGLASAWLLFAYVLRNRFAHPTLALVPFGAAERAPESRFVHWRRLAHPGEPLGGIDAVVVDHRADLPDEWERFVTSCVLAGVPVYDVRHARELLTGRVQVETLSENSFGTLLPSRTYHPIKRLADLLLALALLPVFVPVIALTALLIRLETPGPAIFTQPRMGYRGRPFTIYKLRSMRTDMPEGLAFTADNDPRITRVGRVIRRYRIDEFPQILNILRGDMSWIGPRPEALSLAEWYAREVPFYMYRHAVRPGLTGWAQVNQGNVAEVSAAATKLQYDFYYTKHFSAALDLLIIFRTIKTVMTGFGSK